jgi:UDP-N-acetylmuramyl pentapeptide phosphotransferase/UDP-N-acetylglucosamine-1-phosphate transferase
MYLSPIIAALVTMLLTTGILISKFGKKIQDVPNERSLHKTPTPRIGGVAMVIGILCGWALMMSELTWWIVAPLVGLFVVSLLDDIINLSVKTRFMAHLVASSVLIASAGLFEEYGLLISSIAVIFTVWMINLYNFMDGSDGLAGGMAFFGFNFFGIAALIAHCDTLAILNFTISAGALGFLYNNFPPAKIFMGDAGSIPLGFLVAAMGLLGWQQGCWPMWFPILVFSPFIVDASITLIKRSMRGVKITEAHREHYYQRAVQMGLGHKNVALLEYCLMLGVGGSALWSIQQTMPWQMLIGWTIIYGLFMAKLDARWNKFTKKTA